MDEKVYYSTFNDKKLCGIINILDKNNEIVVICHARTSSKDSRPTTKLANNLTKKKLTILDLILYHVESLMVIIKIIQFQIWC